MDIAKKVELANRLKRDIDSGVELLMKRGLTRAAAVDKVILSPEASKAHQRERQEAAQEPKTYTWSKDPIKAADEGIDALAKQHRANHPGMTHAQCVEHVITTNQENKRLYEEGKRERLRKAALIT
jgi:hypothetical protein